MTDKWKPLDIYPEFKGAYEVSEYGEIRSIGRTVFIEAGERNAYERYYAPRTLVPRMSKKSKHLFTSLAKVDKGDKFVKTIYIHKIVAQLFLPPPTDPEKKYVEHIDDILSNNHYTNLRWITHSELQLRNMHERYPENINRLRDINIKSGYYEDPNKFRTYANKKIKQ